MTSFYIKESVPVSYAMDFIISLSKTLKNVSFPCKFMHPKYQNLLNLDSLTILGPVDKSFLKYCCKTESLFFQDSYQYYTDESIDK